MGSAKSLSKDSNRPINVAMKTVKEFASNTTIHGIQYIFDEYVLIFEKVLWLVIFTIFSYLGISWSLENFNQWQNNPILTSIKTTGFELLWLCVDYTHILSPFFSIQSCIVISKYTSMHIWNHEIGK